MVTVLASRTVLAVHPHTPATLPVTITADVQRPAPDLLRCNYVLEADLARLALPAGAAAERRDELWRHTCFEAFVSDSRSAGYYEFNFSPAGDWAAYRFEAHRAGMTNAQLARAPAVQVRAQAQRLELAVTLELGGLAHLAEAALLGIALAAVIEDRQGALSYWALRHGPGKPDFHHPDAFALKLPTS